MKRSTIRDALIDLYLTVKIRKREDLTELDMEEYTREFKEL